MAALSLFTIGFFHCSQSVLPSASMPSSMKSKSPAWKYTKAEEAELLYLSLAVKHHCGQQLPLPGRKWDWDGDSSDDDDDNLTEEEHGAVRLTAEPSEATTPADTACARIKERFLDSFAELLACRKDARYVSSCALVESEKKAKIFVSRNAGFAPDTTNPKDTGGGADRDFFDSFRMQTRDLRQAYTEAKEDGFFELLVGYYRPRLVYHVKEFLLVSQKKKKKKKKKKEKPSLECSKSHIGRLHKFASFRDLSAAHNQQGLDAKRAQELALLAYKLTRSTEIRSTLRHFYEEDQVERVLRQLRFVARIRAIHLSITECVQTLPNFGKIEVVPIPHPKASNVANASICKARETAMQSLQTYLGGVPPWMNDPQLVARIEDDFYGHPLIVHAEMQMACFFEENRQHTPFPYLGISKKTCYLCAQFLAHLRDFGTRASHAQLHPYWTLPTGVKVRKQRVYSSPGMGLRAVKQNLAEMIEKPTITKLAYLPESTTVWSARGVISSGTVSVASSQISRLMENKVVYSQLSPQAQGQALHRIGLLLPHARLLAGTGQDESSHEATQRPAGDEKTHDTHDTTRPKLDFLAGLLQVHYESLPNDVQRALSLLQVES